MSTTIAPQGTEPTDKKTLYIGIAISVLTIVLLVGWVMFGGGGGGGD